MKIDSNAKKTIQFYLCHYTDMKRKLKSEGEGALFRPWKAKKSITLDKTAAGWVALIDLYLACNESSIYPAFIKHRFWERSNEVRVMRLLHVARTTYYKIQNDVYEQIFLYALQKGLLTLNLPLAAPRCESELA